MDDIVTQQNQQTTVQGWPDRSIPTEIFDGIAIYLEKWEIANLRLVNREFAAKLEGAYFRSSVVPFSPNFYLTESDEEDDIGIFEKLGFQIRRFGITLEFDESLLYNLPKKVKDPSDQSFWGTYDWPGGTYTPFAHTKQLEDLVEQNTRLKKAFSKLTNLSELAICVNNGFGFLDPRASIKNWDNRFGFLNSQTPAGIWFWSSGNKYCFKDGPVVLKSKHPTIKNCGHPFHDEVATSGSRVALTRSRRVAAPDPTRERDNKDRFSLLLDEEQTGNGRGLAPQPYPGLLSRSQVELFAETSWAIQGFLTSFVCAITDNGPALRNVRSLNFSCISSGLLHHFNRSAFFASFPNLSDITLIVVGDWKSMDGTAEVSCPLTVSSPINAPLQLRTLLDGQIVHISTLRSLTLGYMGGGEHDSGPSVRNRNILPAPVGLGPAFPAVPSWTMPDDPLVFKHVKKLTFENCWFTPAGLCIFMKGCEQTALEHITFDSCSVTAGNGSRTRHWMRSECRPTVHTSRYYDQPLRASTWTSLINQFTPGRTIAEQRPHDVAPLGYSQQEGRKLIHIPNLGRLQFISCGYVAIANIFNQNDLVVPDFGELMHLREGMREHGIYFAAYELLGAIVPAIGDDEQLLLREAFGMTIGWDSDGFSKLVRLDVGSDGGEGRFSGSIYSTSPTED